MGADERRFDDIARSVARATSRRTLVARLAGLAGAVGFDARQDARAQGGVGVRGPLGAPCSRATECQSLHCVDGVCCNADCAGQCEACNLSGARGHCSPVIGNPVDSRPSCPGTDPCAGTCDGVDRTHCVFPGAETVCAESACEAGWQTTSVCAGNGTCHPTTTACAPFDCNMEGTACRECVDDAGCDDGDPCSIDVCGASSGRCYHIPISDDCTRCLGDQDCGGGVCCHGRCCPAGAGCDATSAGDAVCCPICREHQCCDAIEHMGGGYYTAAVARCHGPALDLCAPGLCQIVDGNWVCTLPIGAVD